MGNLPTSRTVTLVPGDAVPSNLLNEIQDVFVGGKHGSRPLFVPAIAFTVLNNVPTYSDGVWTTPGGVSLTRWEAPLILQSGTSIDQAEAFYIRGTSNDASNTFTMKIRYRSPVAGAAVPAGVDLMSVQVNAAAASNYPNLDHLLGSAGGLPAIAPAASELYWRFETFENVSAAPHPQFLGIAYTISRL